MVFFNSLYSDISVIITIATLGMLSNAISSDQVIRGFNSTLLNDLKPIVDNWSEEQRLGDVFVKAVSILGFFFCYVNICSKRRDTN